MKKVALVIIYNHRFDKNIPQLENLYSDRFSHIYHLVPFYDGDQSNVIPVYDSSYRFQNYIAQGYKHFFHKDYLHYFFIADDMILNPVINENTYADCLHLSPIHCFFPGFIQFHELNKYWPRTKEATEFKVVQQGIEIEHELPSKTEAENRFSDFGLKAQPLSYYHVLQSVTGRTDGLTGLVKNIIFKTKKLTQALINRKVYLHYPLVGGYSDIFVVAASTMPKFVKYCGVFAAAKLFVEIAVPTSLVLSATKIVTEQDIDFEGKALWSIEEHHELDKFDFDLNQLLRNFPKNYLYLHPVKLSKWKYQFNEQTG